MGRRRRSFLSFLSLFDFPCGAVVAGVRRSRRRDPSSWPPVAVDIVGTSVGCRVKSATLSRRGCPTRSSSVSFLSRRVNGPSPFRPIAGGVRVPSSTGTAVLPRRHRHRWFHLESEVSSVALPSVINVAVDAIAVEPRRIATSCWDFFLDLTWRIVGDVLGKTWRTSTNFWRVCVG